MHRNSKEREGKRKGKKEKKAEEQRKEKQSKNSMKSMFSCSGTSRFEEWYWNWYTAEGRFFLRKSSKFHQNDNLSKRTTLMDWGQWDCLTAMQIHYPTVSTSCLGSCLLIPTSYFCHCIFYLLCTWCRRSFREVRDAPPSVRSIVGLVLLLRAFLWLQFLPFWRGLVTPRSAERSRWLENNKNIIIIIIIIIINNNNKEKSEKRKRKKQRNQGLERSCNSSCWTLWLAAQQRIKYKQSNI